MLKKSLIVGVVAVMAAGSAAPAFAQGLEIGRDGIRLQEPDRGDRRDREIRREVRAADISERQAVRIARSEGVREVDDVSRTRRAYRIEGTDRRGEDIRVDVDRTSGEVLSVR